MYLARDLRLGRKVALKVIHADRADRKAIDAFVEEAIAAHPDVAQQIRDGDDKPLNFLMGQVMKASQGKAEPGQVRKALQERLRSSGA